MKVVVMIGSVLFLIILIGTSVRVQERFPLFLLLPQFLEVENTLLYGQDKEESSNHQELGYGVIQVNIMLLF